MRLIDADEIQKEIRDMKIDKKTDWDKGLNAGLEIAAKLIAAAPTEGDRHE